MKRLLYRPPKQLRVKLKWFAFLTSLAGVSFFWLNMSGAFHNSEKKGFADLIMNTHGFIPRATPGFEGFLQHFKPPAGFSPERVSGIADKELRISSPSDVGATVRYVVDEKWTPSVARFDQVRAWADGTVFEFVSGVLVTVGVLLLIPIEIYEYRQGCAKKREN